MPTEIDIPLPLGVTAEKMRRIEWWALLNCHVRPSDIPAGADESALFDALTAEIPRSERLAFWNGAFGCGKNRSRFV